MSNYSENVYFFLIIVSIIVSLMSIIAAYNFVFGISLIIVFLVILITWIYVYYDKQLNHLLRKIDKLSGICYTHEKQITTQKNNELQHIFNNKLECVKLAEPADVVETSQISGQGGEIKIIKNNMITDSDNKKNDEEQATKSVPVMIENKDKYGRKVNIISYKNDKDDDENFKAYSHFNKISTGSGVYRKKKYQDDLSNYIMNPLSIF